MPRLSRKRLAEPDGVVNESRHQFEAILGFLSAVIVCGGDAGVGIAKPALHGACEKVVLPRQTKDGLGAAGDIRKSQLLDEVVLEVFPKGVVAGLKALNDRLRNGFAVEIGQVLPILQHSVVFKLEFEVFQ